MPEYSIELYVIYRFDLLVIRNLERIEVQLACIAQEECLRVAAQLVL